MSAATAATGCSGDAVTGDAREPALTRPAPVAVPAEDLTVVAGSSASELALGTSGLLFHAAPLVILAPEDDVAAQAVAASVAVARRAPLLLVPPGEGAASATVRDELDRLDTDVALAVGELPGAATLALGDVAVAGLAVDDTAAAADLLGAPDPADPLPRSSVTSAVAQLDPASPVLLTVAGAGPGTDAQPGVATDIPVLPSAGPAAPADDVLVLSRPDPAWSAATASARAAGARVVVMDTADPRASPAAIEALGGDPVAVVAVGDDFGPAAELEPRLRAAATGVQLPGGGQLLFPHRRLVALYGSPVYDSLGSLGEQPLDEAVARARQVAASYQPHSPEPVVPTFEVITTVASGGAGPDGDYSEEMPVEVVRPWVDRARDEGIYVVLDLQPGRTDFLTQARRYEELLREPHVGLALDPEWRLAPDQRHLEQVGSVGAAEVNEVAQWLAELTATHRLPQKLLLLHQFSTSMISDRDQLDLSHDELAVLIHADGFGTPGEKLGTWQTLRRDAPGVWWGWKNFYDEDAPTMTPEQTMAVDPRPWFVSYQ